MKIVWISHTSNLEGAERCLLEAVKGLTKQGNENYVIVPSQGSLVSLLENLEAFVYVTPYPWWTNEQKDKKNPIKRLLQYAKSVWRLAKILWEIHPEVVVTNTLVVPSGAFAAKLLRIPHVWYIHEFFEEDHQLSFELGKSFSLLLVNFLSSEVIVNSKAVYKKFVKNFPSLKMHKVYYAVDISDQLDRVTEIKKEKDKFYISLVGRKSFGKGQEDAIRAVSILIKKGLKIHLWLIGGGEKSYIEYLSNLVQALEISNSVEFISFVETPLSYTKSADIQLICSKCEAFGRVTIEAMKLGKPIIGSDSGATSELIQNEYNGLLYPEGDFDSLAQNIELLYEKSDFRKELGSNAYKTSSSQFTLEQYALDLKSVFIKAVD